jgi:hypothetical protein
MLRPVGGHRPIEARCPYGARRELEERVQALRVFSGLGGKGPTAQRSRRGWLRAIGGKPRIEVAAAERKDRRLADGSGGGGAA